MVIRPIGRWTDWPLGLGSPCPGRAAPQIGAKPGQTRTRLEPPFILIGRWWTLIESNTLQHIIARMVADFVPGTTTGCARARSECAYQIGRASCRVRGYMLA